MSIHKLSGYAIIDKWLELDHQSVSIIPIGIAAAYCLMASDYARKLKASGQHTKAAVAVNTTAALEKRKAQTSASSMA